MTSQDYDRTNQENHERDCGYGKQKRSKVFQDMDLEEIQELIDCTLVALAEGTLMEISASKLEPDDEEENTRKSCARKQTDNRRSDRKKGSNYSRLLLTSFIRWRLI